MLLQLIDLTYQLDAIAKLLEISPRHLQAAVAIDRSHREPFRRTLT
jgi:PIN domain nuclease of toxin-antitoxin system